MMLDDRGVQALGKVSEERKLAELARARGAVRAVAAGESFGMVLTEAFAAGTPVIASDIPGYRDVLRDGLDGLLSPARRRARAGRGAARARARPGLRARMALPARERAERFAWPHVAAEVLDAYEQAIARRRAGAPRSGARRPCATASRPRTCCRASPPSGCRACSRPEPAAPAAATAAACAPRAPRGRGGLRQLAGRRGARGARAAARRRSRASRPRCSPPSPGWWRPASG